MTAIRLRAENEKEAYMFWIVVVAGHEACRFVYGNRQSLTSLTRSMRLGGCW
jgi:hypothetical protein